MSSTASEQKELQRVFDQLANFLTKKDLYKELRLLEERKGRLGLHLKNPLAIKVSYELSVPFIHLNLIN